MGGLGQDETGDVYPDGTTFESRYISEVTGVCTLCWCKLHDVPYKISSGTPEICSSWQAGSFCLHHHRGTMQSKGKEINVSCLLVVICYLLPPFLLKLAPVSFLVWEESTGNTILSLGCLQDAKEG